MYLMFSSQKRNLFYCSDECRAPAYKLTRASKLPCQNPTHNRKAEYDRAKALSIKNKKPSLKAIAKEAQARLRERDEEYWRQLRVSYNLEDRRV
jgi:hypothetical protein